MDLLEEETVAAGENEAVGQFTQLEEQVEQRRSQFGIIERRSGRRTSP
jgi:hypothetical protein